MAGMEFARRHGTKSSNRIGRPRHIFDHQEVLQLRESGMSIERLAKQMRIGVGTVVRVMRANQMGPVPSKRPQPEPNRNGDSKGFAQAVWAFLNHQVLEEA
jgi:hypothetical protein